MSTSARGSGAPAPAGAPFRFSISTRVEIADTDLGAVVYYGRYPHFLDRALIAYRRQLGIPALGPDGHLFVVRRLEIEYLSSARFDDELVVWVRTARIGRSSHTMEFRIDDASSAAAVLTAREVIVGVSAYEGGRPTRIPAGMRDPISAFEGPELEQE
jgi:acyl-CoA thioester hydrolase